jgi:secreted trypsin-like serine protease
MRTLPANTIRLLIAVGAVCSAAALAPSAGAVTNGTPDGSTHPYVGIADSGDVFCSGTLLSPRVFLTAGHCTAAFSASQQPTFVTFDANAGRDSVYITGTPYTEPGFFNVPPQHVGVPASVGHDLGVIVLDRPVELPSYGQLPAPGALTGANGTPMTVVGYGAQDWVPAPGGRIPVFTFTRTAAQVQLINDTNAIGDEFVRLSTNPGDGKGGIGPGDSGGPAFVDGGTTIGAIGSHVSSPAGSGTAYFSRLDTADARAFIGPFLHG